MLELILVVCIVGILAAVAIPNFLRLRLRAKVSTIQYDLQNLARSLEGYRLDHGDFPPSPYNDDVASAFAHRSLAGLAEAVPYMGHVSLTDGFRVETPTYARNIVQATTRGSYVYVFYRDLAALRKEPELLSNRGFCVLSVGPDCVDSYGIFSPFPDHYPWNGRGPNLGLYSASNGTVSQGDICVFGGNSN